VLRCRQGRRRGDEVDREELLRPNAGFKEGDVILEVGGKAVASADDAAMPSRPRVRQQEQRADAR